VIVEGYVREVRIRELVVRDICAIDLELEFVIVVENGEGATLPGRQVLHWVIEIQFLNLRLGSNRLLDLGDEHVLGLGREHFALIGVKVGVVGVDVPLHARVGRSRAPGDAELNIVVLERNEGKRRLPVLTEGETEGVEPFVGGTTVEVTRDRLGRTGRREGGGDEGGVGGILLIHNLTTDEELHLGDHSGPIRYSLGRRAIVGNEVDIAKHVSLPLEADGGHTIVRDVALDDLTLDSLGKVGVTLVGRSEKADLWLANEVDILSTDGNELGNTTRHFILYGEFIFKLTFYKLGLESMTVSALSTDRWKIVHLVGLALSLPITLDNTFV